MVHSEPFRQYDTYKTIRLYYQTEQQNVFQALALRNERLTFQRIKKQQQHNYLDTGVSGKEKRRLCIAPNDTC